MLKCAVDDDNVAWALPGQRRKITPSDGRMVLARTYALRVAVR
jgi:hypothetical protein